MAGRVKLTEAQRRRLAAMVARWDREETWINVMLPDDGEFGSKTEMLRNLGSTMAAGRAVLSSEGRED